MDTRVGELTRNRPSTAPVPGTSTYRITDKGNTTMKVVVRIRPENEAEASSGAPTVARVLDSHVLVFDPTPENIPSFHALNPFKKRGPLLGRKYKDLRFAFDRVFDETSTQQQVFEESTKNIVENVLDGVNCSVFAYGATGAGKTHTMLGTSDSPGVMFHTMMELYHCITKLKDNKIFEVVVSYCEVYNEGIHDLLGSPLDGGSLELREDPKNGLIVSNLSRHQLQTAEEILTMLERGNKNRTQHPTDANATSSRSHAVFQVFVHQKPRTAAINPQMTCAKLSLIDLAGSERATVTTNRGARLREGANINKSLLALGNCINALAEERSKSVHVPYRNSKLTRLLKDSLGGNCRTVMIANVSPSGLSYEDTYNTLKYADRAKQIKTKVVRNVLNVEFHVSRYRVIVQELQTEIAELKSKLETRALEKKTVSESNVSSRLQELVRGVYGERSRLRKHMVDLDTQERETLLRICRKERDLHRIDTLTGNEAKKSKLAAKVTELQRQIVDIERQKQIVHEYLYSNNETVTRVQKEVKTATANLPIVQEVMKEVVEGRKLETENAHHWRQTKHLLRYVKAQEREIGKTERILLLALEVARKQHSLLKAHNALTPSLREMFSDLVHTAEGEKGVAWADLNAKTSEGVQNTHTLMAGGPGVDHSTLSVSQKALFDTFIVHASPARRLSLDKHSPATLSKPVSGILNNNTGNPATSTANCTGERNIGTRWTSETDSGVCTVVREPSSVSETSSSAVSSLLSSRLYSIPDKPRMPTPIEDLSSSCSSNNSIYDTHLNTVMNNHRQRPSPGLLRVGRYTKLPRSRSGTPTACDSPRDTPRGTPEPYLTPIPSLHKLTLTRQNSECYLSQQASNNNLNTATHTTMSGTNTTAVSSSGIVNSSSSNRGEGDSRLEQPMTSVTSSAFTTLTGPFVAMNQTTPQLHHLISTATKLQTAPIPPPRVRTTAKSSLLPPRLQPSCSSTTPSFTARPHVLPPVAPSSSSTLSRTAKTHLPPPLLPPSLSASSPSLNKFEDNFVTSHTSLSTSRHVARTLESVGSLVPQSIDSKHEGFEASDPDSCDSRQSSKEASGSLSQVSAVSSHSNSSTVKSMEPQPSSHTTLLCKPYPSSSSSPVVTVETHSTVVSVHPPPPSRGLTIPATTRCHSVNVDLNHTHKGAVGTDTQVKTRPLPAFIPTHQNNKQIPLGSKCSATNLSDRIRALNYNPRVIPNSNGEEKQGVCVTDQEKMNSTFTVESSKPRPKPRLPGGGSGEGKKRLNGVGFKTVPGALKMLYVNSPRALDDRARESVPAESAKVKGSRDVPSYLQLTKSAASKRVTKLQNKENGTASQAKKPLGQGRSAFRMQPVAQPTC